jgi:hypothetical protein
MTSRCNHQPWRTVHPRNPPLGVVFAIVLAVIQYIDRVCIPGDAHIARPQGSPMRRSAIFSAFGLACVFEIPPLAGR